MLDTITILPLVSGFLGIITPMYVNFHPDSTRRKYMKEMMSKGFLLSPSIGLFVCLWMFSLVLFPLFELPTNAVALIVGCVYIYIVLMYSVVDEKSTLGMSMYFTYNLCLICQTYSQYPNTESVITSFGLLLLFASLTTYICMNTSTIELHSYWFMWYSATISGVCRWRLYY